MSRASLEIWEKRFNDKKESGLNVAVWCEKNIVTRYENYYWKKRVDALTPEDSVSSDTILFAELPRLSEPKKGFETSKLLISWKDLQITVSNASNAELAAEFMSQLLNWVEYM